MSTNFPSFRSNEADDLPDLRRHSTVFIVLGALLALTGIVALSYPILATISTLELFGILLLIGSGVQIASSFWARRWGGFFQHLFLGLLYLFLGAVIVEQPLLAATVYTLLMAMFFVAAGLFRIIYSLSQRFSGRGFVLLSGVISLLLGAMIWRGLPEASLVVIGIFVGIELIFTGLSWVMLGLASRSISTPEAKAGEAPSKLVGV